ncbi:LIM/homeobox protein Awh-like isoform X1 [Neodiprion virginianus]|uniref:LIM/homeobox protein Awh-like isoform X1 n=2 Tax=Neodiprion fabricii TaxID=2872261 RepID=UPI001ED94788|nr:LIM/homeobox protein Awh-like isoform X1 [Neodiprion fabricii]XP_046605734.1 LIM/homeobox protein Awh-like isoform X1 [Neodiprion virginianus]
MKTEIETDPESTDATSCLSVKNTTNNNNNNNNTTTTNNNNSDNDAMDMDMDRLMECGGCGDRVRERTVLCVGGRTWHSRCLRCCACARPLHDQHSCFLRGMRLYCRHDYAMAFGAKCAKCGRSVGAGDWVRRARERVYHLACFACDACSRQLSTGEQFALLDARLLCKAHYLDVVEGNNTSSSEDGDSEGGKANKAKRVRTTFTEEQLSVLQANFQLDSNPDGQDLERIAHVTGLSKRVTQVWFQNSRARQKKHCSGKVKTQMHHSPPLQHHPGDLYGGVNVVQGVQGAYLQGTYQSSSVGSESPGSPMTPMTPSTPTLMQPQFCHQSGTGRFISVSGNSHGVTGA